MIQQAVSSENSSDPFDFPKQETKMKRHRQRLLDDLQGYTPSACALFALLCAERLRGCCWAFQEAEKSDMSPYFDWTEELFQLLIRRVEPNGSRLKDMVRHLEGIVPSGGEPLAVQAQSGMLSLLAAGEILISQNSSGVIDAANSIVDALDNYDFFVRRRLKNDMSSPTDYPLLQREMNRQLADVAFVQLWDQGKSSDPIDYRVENLQFAVPIAV